MGFEMFRFVFIVLLFNGPVSAVAAENNFLSLQCSVVAGFGGELCFAKTASPHGPFDDVVFYRRTEQGELYLLSSQITGGSAFAGFDFSDKGRYMWVSWADEGHPYFSFYKTEAFLDDGEDAKTLSILSVYGFENFKSFTDEGMVIYTLEQGESEACQNKPCTYRFDLNDLVKNNR